MTQNYNLPNIRTLLIKGFTDQELRQLSYDHFRPVHDQLAESTGKDVIADRLIQYAEQTMSMDKLLALAKAHNPPRYETHKPYTITDPTPPAGPEATWNPEQYRIALNWAAHGRQGSLTRFNLSGADLRLVDLAGANLTLANLSRADLQEANLSQADLRRADLNGANLRGAQIDETTQIDDKWRLVWEIVTQGAVGRDLRGADLSGANLSGANLSGAKLREANLRGADLHKADLRKANLSWANLSWANLSETNLSGADLSGADLSWADLSGADLSGADLSGADLSWVNLSGAKYDISTRWPIGFNPKKAGAFLKL